MVEGAEEGEGVAESTFFVIIEHNIEPRQRVASSPDSFPLPSYGERERGRERERERERVPG